MSYKVTIGIPVYNAARYIAGTLQSALDQTFESIEFLILDDCSSDDSFNIVSQVKARHPRGADIRLLQQPRNMGIGHARNRIIDEAQGQYLFFLDSDDLLPSDAIERLYSPVISHGAQIVYGSNDRVLDYGDEKKVEHELYSPMEFLHGDDFANYAYESYGNIPANVWKYLIDINVYRMNHLRFPDINFWEDFAMTMDLPTYIERAVFLPDVTYQYFCRYGTLSNNQKRTHIDKQEIVKIATAIGQLKENGSRIKNKPYYLKRCFKVMMTEFYMVCYVLKHRAIIHPSFSKRELRDMMRSPLAWGDVVGLDKWRLKNLALYLLGVMPPSCSVAWMMWLGKIKKLV